MVEENQPGLFAQLNVLPWAQVPVVHVEHDRGHGRTERRTIQVLPAPDMINLPHVAQAFLAERYVADLAGNITSAVAVPGVTSRPTTRADPSADRLRAARTLGRVAHAGLGWMTGHLDRQVAQSMRLNSVARAPVHGANKGSSSVNR